MTVANFNYSLLLSFSFNKWPVPLSRNHKRGCVYKSSKLPVGGKILA